MIGIWKRVEMLEGELTAAQHAASEWRGEHAAAVARAEVLGRQLDAANARIDALLERLAAMQREGFAMPARPDAAVAPADDLPPAVVSAILDRAKPGDALWGRLMLDAQAALAADGDAEKVAEMVRAGGTYNPWS